MSAVVDHLLLGIIRLLKYDCSGCFQVWLKALDILSTSDHQSSLSALHEILFPRNDTSFEQIVRLFTDETSRDQDLSHCFTNFMAYNYVSVLYSKWWEVSRNRCKRPCYNKLSTDTKVLSGEIQNVKTVDLGLSSHDDISEAKVEIDNLPLPSSSIQNGVQILDVYSFVSFMSSVLLSEIYTNYYKCKTGLKIIEEKILEADIKKRLQEHILSQQSRKQSSSTVTGTTVGDGVSEQVKEYLDGVIDQELLCIQNDSVSTDHLKEEANLPKKSNDHEQLSEYEKPGKDLLTIKNNLLQEVNTYPVEIKVNTLLSV